MRIKAIYVSLNYWEPVQNQKGKVVLWQRNVYRWWVARTQWVIPWHISFYTFWSEWNMVCIIFIIVLIYLFHLFRDIYQLLLFPNSFTRIAFSVLMNCFKWGSCHTFEITTKKPMELALISNFHRRKPRVEIAIRDPLYPKLNT